jgi:hypothetical protein
VDAGPASRLAAELREESMRTAERIESAIAVALLCSCVHAQPRPASNASEELLARAVWWATRVPEPAAEYHVDLPPLVDAARVLGKAARYAQLDLEDSNVLRRSSRNPGRSVRLSLDAPRRVTDAEVVVPFRYGYGESEFTACAVRIRREPSEPDSWDFRGEGLEQCWPRPGQQP